MKLYFTFFSLESDPLYRAQLHHYLNLSGARSHLSPLHTFNPYPPHPVQDLETVQSLRMGLNPAPGPEYNREEGKYSKHKVKPGRSSSDKFKSSFSKSNIQNKRPKIVDLDSSGDDIKVIEIDSAVTTSTTLTCTTAVSTSMTVSSSTSVVFSSTPIPSTAPSDTLLATKIPKIEPKTEPDANFIPKCLFVRPFEDDYSPVRPESRSCEPSSGVSPSSGIRVQTLKFEISEKKVDDQDSDYESMSSDSSIKRESLCESLNKSDSFSSYPEISSEDSSFSCKLEKDSSYQVKVEEEVVVQESKEMNGFSCKMEEEEENVEEKEEQVHVVPSLEDLTLCPTSGKYSFHFFSSNFIFTDNSFLHA